MPKQFCALLILIDGKERWWAALGLDNEQVLIPLGYSKPDFFMRVYGPEFDNEVLELRHKLVGVLSMSYARLGLKGYRVGQHAFVMLDEMDFGYGNLIPRLSHDLVNWQHSPPVATICCANSSLCDVPSLLSSFDGDCEQDLRELVASNLYRLKNVQKSITGWELRDIPPKGDE